MDISVIEIYSIKEAERQIKNIGSDEYSVPLMSSKAVTRAVLINSIDNRAANIIKQEMLSIGGDAALNNKVSRFQKGKSSVLILGTLKQYQVLMQKLVKQPFGLKEYADSIGNALCNYELNDFVLNCGFKKLRLGSKPLVMGILNVTPDSFSDAGKYFSTEEAVKHALDMTEQGADIIDIGGESSRPGAKPIKSSEEIKRVLPVIKNLVKKAKVPISIDTYKPEVAKAAINEGASIVNDITGLRYADGSMVKVVSRYNVPIIIMHMQKDPQSMQKAPVYKNVISDLYNFFSNQIKFAVNNGIKENQIIIDPGIGFGKTLDHNLEILKNLKSFKIFAKPIAIGTSRKSFIGSILNNIVPGERLIGSIASFVHASLNGANILRVHDVKETVQALKITDAIRSI